MSKKPIFNTHAHVFTGNFVPPFLTKTMLPWPIYYLIHTQFFVTLVKWYFDIKNFFDYDIVYRAAKDTWYGKLYNGFRNALKKFQGWLFGQYLLRIPIKIFIYFLCAIAIFYSIDLFGELLKMDKEGWIAQKLSLIRSWLTATGFDFNLSTNQKLLFILTLLIFIKSSRRFLLFVWNAIFPVLKSALSSGALDVIERYYLLGRFATTYKTQSRIAGRAIRQLPADSGLVILPMDMRFMKAGRTFPNRRQKKIAKNNYTNDDLAKNLTYTESFPNWNYKFKLNFKFKDSYKYQIIEIDKFYQSSKTADGRKKYYPFLFIDPRRVKDDKDFFKWSWNGDLENPKMVLDDCYVKTVIEDKGFCGFKIYPALGYHCFDEYLLPIWRYAAENNIPIMTHCIMGRIYYRGTIKSNWHYHPVFKENDGNSPKFLPESKNYDFQRNFTHPLNYLCLLEPDLLLGALKAVKDAGSGALKAFRCEKGQEENGDLEALKNLKICLAHYGGEDEWIRYMESDRNNYSQELMQRPDFGINLIRQNTTNEFSWGKVNNIWMDADWYSIISSMLLQYQNVYADLSYILSKASVYPLIKESVQNKALRKKILFGTDFYVVRNHKSDKNLFVDLKSYLGEEKFDLIAIDNPADYLSK
ncbi:hypothetical protein [Winogradskyella sp.]|uniref:hypothetical protein n=1 Tax=Winogradskyella sp. TaxID=1883156 RepID=UPI003BAB05D1